MSDYNEGDLIEAVKGESVVRGRLKKATYPSVEHYLYVGESAALHQVYLRNGWAVTIIEKAKPKLPEEFGWYLDCVNDAWELSVDGWRWEGGTRSADTAAEYAPFTKLEPVAETAKRVLERVAEILPGPFPNEFGTLAAEFGVTN